MTSKLDDSDTVIPIRSLNPRTKRTLEQLDVRADSTIDLHHHSSQGLKTIGYTVPFKLHKFLTRFYYSYYIYIRCFLLTTLIILCNIYLYFAIERKWRKTPTMCEGIKILTITTLFVSSLVIYFCALKPLVGYKIERQIEQLTAKVENNFPVVFTRNFKIIIGCLICVAIIAMVLPTSGGFRSRFIAMTGIIILIFLGFLFSNHRNQIDWALVSSGLAMQFIFGFFMLRWPVGQWGVECLSNKVTNLISYSDRGTEKLFGYLVTGEMTANSNVVFPNQSFILPFKIFTIIVFLSLITSVLFYYGILPWIIIKIGWILHKIIGTTAVESTTASANIFLGMTEAPLTVRPYLKRLTKAEIHSVMTGGFATIAGTVLVAFIALGVDGSHLVTASVMSAPAALAFAKLLYPETEETSTSAAQIGKLDSGGDKSLLEAVINGVNQGMLLLINVIANLVVFVAMVKLIDSILVSFGSLIGLGQFNTQWLFSHIFTPFAFFMGVDWKDCGIVGELIGLKTVLNEFIAYLRLLELRADSRLSHRSEMIAIYALCGFSNPGSVGISIGALGAMMPERLPDITSVAVRSMIAGSAASFLTACIAGVLLED